jgi:hypothetical protein
LDNGFLLVKEDERLVSPLAVLFFEYYEDLPTLDEKLTIEKEHIQCIVTALAPLSANWQPTVDFGRSQDPSLWDYADGVDTMDFLTKL